jgi:hypothetical protein
MGAKMHTTRRSLTVVGCLFLGTATLLPALLANAAGVDTGDAGSTRGERCREGLARYQDSFKQGEVFIQYKQPCRNGGDAIDVSSLLCFDYPAGRVRFERSRGDEGAEKFARTKTDTYVYLPGRGIIARHAANHQDIFLGQFVPDPRILGMASYGEWTSAMSRADLDPFLDKHFVGVEEQSPGRSVMTWEYDFGTPSTRGQQMARRTVVIDEDKGYLPVEVDVFYRWPDEDFGQASFSATVEYKSVGKGTVPVKCRFTHDESPFSRSSKPCTIDVELDWLSVNQPLDAAKFSPSGLNLPAGTLVVDREKEGDARIILQVR